MLRFPPEMIQRRFPAQRRRFPVRSAVVSLYDVVLSVYDARPPDSRTHPEFPRVFRRTGATEGTPPFVLLALEQKKLYLTFLNCAFEQRARQLSGNSGPKPRLLHFVAAEIFIGQIFQESPEFVIFYTVLRAVLAF